MNLEKELKKNNFSQLIHKIYEIIRIKKHDLAMDTELHFKKG